MSQITNQEILIKVFSVFILCYIKTSTELQGSFLAGQAGQGGRRLEAPHLLLEYIK